MRLKRIDGRIATVNAVKGFDYFGDGLVSVGGEECRFFNPSRSKLAAALVRELPVEFGGSEAVLYLGAAHGYTVSHVCNLVPSGVVYGVEFSPRCFAEFLPVCKKLKNAVPIFADARKPVYSWVGAVDVVFSDLAQPDQTEIALRNADLFLRPGGTLMVAIKARSIDVTRSPKKVCASEIEKLKSRGYRVVSWDMLDPFERDHGFVIARKEASPPSS